jgi:hypothetical protein
MNRRPTLRFSIKVTAAFFYPVQLNRLIEKANIKPENLLAQPIEEIAEEVLKQLPDALSDERESRKRRTVTLPVKLMERNSSMPKSKARAVMKSLEHEEKTVN